MISNLLLFFILIQSNNAQDIIVNGGFESSLFSPWYHPDGQDQFDIVSVNAKQSGSFGASLGSSTLRRMSQDIVTGFLNTQYNLTFWLRNVDQQFDNQITVEWYTTFTRVLLNKNN